VDRNKYHSSLVMFMTYIKNGAEQPMPAKKSKDRKWSVHLIRSKQTYIGSVSAPDEKAAIETAKKELPIPKNLQDRLVVRRH
jgi:hypothetical protein